MKKAVLIIAALGCFLFGCKGGYSGYSSYHPLTTYTAPNTAAGGVQGYFGNTNQIVPTYNYGYYYPNYGYNYGYKYYYPRNPYVYYYNYYTPYFSPRLTYYNGGHCDAEMGSKLNLFIDAGSGIDTRNLGGEKLRAQIFGKRTEVEYGNDGEKINFLADEKGHAYVSGKLLVDGELKKIEPKNQTCTSSRIKSEEDPESEIATFNCTGDLKIKAEALIPPHEQHLSLK